MLKGVIFDMDGVLVDNIKVHMRVFAEFARRHGVEFNEEEVLSMSGWSNEQLFRRTFPAAMAEGKGWKALGDEKEALYREMYAPDMKPAKGLREFLASLKAAGIRAAVGTSAIRANLDFILDGLDLRQYFDTTVNADMVTRCKPDPEIYLTGLRLLDIEPWECLVFEDAVAGIDAAHAAGIGVVALSTTIPGDELALISGVVDVIADFTEIDVPKARSLV